ncbi:uncharacterized protein ACB058_009537 [Synchiropus picturatus]
MISDLVSSVSDAAKDYRCGAELQFTDVALGYVPEGSTDSAIPGPEPEAMFVHVPSAATDAEPRKVLPEPKSRGVETLMVSQPEGPASLPEPVRVCLAPITTMEQHSPTQDCGARSSLRVTSLIFSEVATLSSAQSTDLWLAPPDPVPLDDRTSGRETLLHQETRALGWEESETPIMVSKPQAYREGPVEPGLLSVFADLWRVDEDGMVPVETSKPLKGRFRGARED